MCWTIASNSALLAALMGEKGMPGDDLRLLEHPEELWQQDGQGRHGDGGERHEVARPGRSTGRHRASSSHQATTKVTTTTPPVM